MSLGRTVIWKRYGTTDHTSRFRRGKLLQVKFGRVSLYEVEPVVIADLLSLLHVRPLVKTKILSADRRSDVNGLLLSCEKPVHSGRHGLHVDLSNRI